VWEVTEDEKLILMIYKTLNIEEIDDAMKLILIKEMIKQNTRQEDANWVQQKLDADFERQKTINDFEAGT
jgi:hypothetical protein